MTTPPALRVLHLASGDGWGGAERVLAMLAEGFAGDPRIQIETVLLNEGQLAATLRAQSNPLSIIPESGKSFWRLFREVRAHIHEQEPDVVHVHRYKEIVLAVMATWRRHQRVVVTVHGLQPSSQQSLRGIFVAWGAALLGRLAHAQFAAVSPELTQRISRTVGASRVVEIKNPMPVPHDRFDRIDLHKQLGWPPELPIIGFVGRLEEVKGPDRFIELALKSPAELGFVIIGGGSMEQTLRNRVEQSGHEERVRLIGQVRDAVPYLDSLDLVVLTSLHEGTPMIVLEAASREIPVIAFDVGGLGALLGSCGDGRLVPDGDIDAMRSTIDRLLSSPDETRAETRLWATALRDVFGMSAIIDAHVELYSSLFAE